MGEVKAFVRSTRVNEVIKGLRLHDFKSMTVTDVEGTGRFTMPDASPSLNFTITHSKMTKLELLCKKEDVKTIVKLIHEYSGTGEKGDGIIYVSEIEMVYKVRTGKESLDE